MKNKIIKKILLAIVICLLPIFLYSCKNNKKPDSNNNQYYENGLDKDNWYYRDRGYGPDYYPNTGLRVKIGAAIKQEVEVYYGFNENLYENITNILYEGSLVSSYKCIYILNETDLNQQIKFTLYRKTSESKMEKNPTIVEVFSFVNTLGWFYSPDFNFEYCKEDNKFIDTVTKEDLFIGNNTEGYLSYYYELTPVEGETINFVAYYKSAKEIQNYENRYGTTMREQDYLLYKYPSKIISIVNYGMEVARNNSMIYFIKPDEPITGINCIRN